MKAHLCCQEHVLLPAFPSSSSIQSHCYELTYFPQVHWDQAQGRQLTEPDFWYNQLSTVGWAGQARSMLPKLPQTFTLHSTTPPTPPTPPLHPARPAKHHACLPPRSSRCRPPPWPAAARPPPGRRHRRRENGRVPQGSAGPELYAGVLVRWRLRRQPQVLPGWLRHRLPYAQ